MKIPKDEEKPLYWTSRESLVCTQLPGLDMIPTTDSQSKHFNVYNYVSLLYNYINFLKILQYLTIFVRESKY